MRSVVLVARIPDAIGLQWHPQAAPNPALLQSESPPRAANPSRSPNEPQSRAPNPARSQNERHLSKPSLWPSEVRADLVVLASQWHIALGQEVRAEARLEGADADSTLIALNTAEQSSEIPAFGFVAQPVSNRIPIVETLDPQQGKRMQVDGLLVLRESAADAPVLIVRVTAF